MTARVAQPISATPIAASGPAVLRHLPRRTRAIPPRSRLLGCVGKPVRPRVVGDTDQVGRAGHSQPPLVPPDPQGLLGDCHAPWPPPGLHDGHTVNGPRGRAWSRVRASDQSAGGPAQHGPDAHLVGHLHRISIIEGLIVCCWRLWLPGADPGRGRGGRPPRTRRPPVAVPGPRP